MSSVVDQMSGAGQATEEVKLTCIEFDAEEQILNKISKCTFELTWKVSTLLFKADS